MGVLGLQTERVAIPHEADQWIEIRTELSPHVKDRAAEARQVDNLTSAGGVVKNIGTDGFQAVVKMLDEGAEAAEVAAELEKRNRLAAGDVVIDQEDGGDADPPEVLEERNTAEASANGAGEQLRRARDPRRLYDLDVAASFALVTWSYRHPVTDKPLPPTLDHIRNLDPATRRFVHEQVWKRLEAVESFEGN